MKKTLLVVFILAVLGAIVFRNSDDPIITLTELEARALAEASCIKEGEALTTGMYNEATKTWWFDANLDATREGCDPACVVNEVTRTAEINWRCTGVIPPDDSTLPPPPNPDECGIENCHGLDIVCGPNPAQICTEIYQFGDRCRQYAQCAVVDGTCQSIENQHFVDCRACVQSCERDFSSDPDAMFVCESECEAT